MEDKIKPLDPRVQKLIRTYLEVLGDLPAPASCGKLVQMDLKLKPEFVGRKIRRRPYPASKGQADEIERQIQECMDAGLVLEYKDGDYPQHCSPCFLVAKTGSTAKWLVVDYGGLNKKTPNHSVGGSATAQHNPHTEHYSKLPVYFTSVLYIPLFWYTCPLILFCP